MLLIRHPKLFSQRISESRGTRVMLGTRPQRVSESQFVVERYRH